MRKIAVLIISFIIFFNHNILAQKDNSAKAEAAFKTGQYFAAIDLYKYAYGKAKDKQQKAEIKMRHWFRISPSYSPCGINTTADKVRAPGTTSILSC